MLDDWQEINDLSRGAQGTTHRVKRKDDESGQIYALKKLLKNKNFEKAKKRFEKEIQAGLQLNHPNILKIIDYDIETKNPFLVSEYCSGGTLKKLDLQDLTILDKLRIFLQICNAVGFAHSHTPQIIHRDLKPENIFLKEDGKTPIVGDFGICFIDDDGERLTLVDDEAVGARKFTSPELEDGRNDFITPAADVYSLGKILYWMLDGKIFSRENHKEEKWDLRKDTTNPAIFYIYDLLDKTIVHYPEERLKDANEISENIEQIIHKIMTNAHSLDLNVPQECLFCGTGFYEPYLEFKENFNTVKYPLQIAHTHIGSDLTKWRESILVLICKHCGNMQRFQPPYEGWHISNWKGILPQGM